MHTPLYESRPRTKEETLAPHLKLYLGRNVKGELFKHSAMNLLTKERKINCIQRENCFLRSKQSFAQTCNQAVTNGFQNYCNTQIRDKTRD